MDIDKEKKILNIAHRGASGHAPENTLASFQAAIELGADMIELDLHRSKDGHLVVIHDRRLTRVGKKKWAVNEMGLEELRSIDVGSWFGDEFRGARIPTLREVLELTRDRIGLNIEIKKGYRPYDLIEKSILDLIGKYRMLDHVLISSFEDLYLENIRGLDKSARIGLLIDRGSLIKGLKKALFLGAEAVNIPKERVTKEAVKMARGHNLRLYVYTVNEITEMKRYIDMGIDGIFTNYPDRLKRLLLGRDAKIA